MIDKEKMNRDYIEFHNQNLENLLKQWGTGFEELAEELKEYPEIEFNIDDSSQFTQMQFIKRETTQEVFKQTDTKMKIINALREDAPLTRDALAQKVNVSANAVKQHLVNLKKANFIKRVGSTKSSSWEVLDGNRLLRSRK
jgi:predicted HTH transcriptional regulator